MIWGHIWGITVCLVDATHKLTIYPGDIIVKMGELKANPEDIVKD